MCALLSAYLLRLRSSIKSALIQASAFSLAITLLVIVTGLFCPQVYTPLTHQALVGLAHIILGVTGEVPNEILGVLAAAIYAPFLAALIAAVVASNIVSSAFSKDKASGVFEVLLSAPISRRDIAIMLITTTALIALITAFTTLAATTLIAIPFLYLLGYLNTLSSYYVSLSLLLVPSTSVLAALIGLIVTVLMPLAARIRTGLAPWQNLTSTIALIPVLIPFIILNINPNLNPLILAIYTTLAIITLSILIISITPRILKPESLIA